MEGVNKSEPEVPQHLIDDAKPQLLETARFLRGVQDHHPDEFKTVAKKLKIGLRKAYHLAQIDRRFDELGIPTERLQRLGWTKLSILAAYGKPDTIDELLDMATNCTAHELKMYIREGGFDPEARTVVLHLDKEQYELLEEALRAKGAEPHSRGLLGKEAALMRLVTESKTAEPPAPAPAPAPSPC